MVTDAQIGVAIEAFDQKAGYSKIEKMRAALEAALSAAEPVSSIVPDHCSGTTLNFEGGCLHVRKDGSGHIVVDEDDFKLEDDRCEGEHGPEGSVHWIARFPAGEMTALRNFLNGQDFPAPPAPSSAPPQCCMCGKKGLSTAEGDGGTECELSYGRWVCSAECWDRAVEPAPSVAVKALEWQKVALGTLDWNWLEVENASTAFGAYSLQRHNTGHLRVMFGGKVVNFFEPEKHTDARAAAQADYEARIRSALAAQVQDVAGWQPIETAPHDTNVLLAWTDSTLPCGWKMEAGMASWGWRRDGVSNMSEHGQATHWMPLPAAPARQEGGESNPVHEQSVDSGESGDE